MKIILSAVEPELFHAWEIEFKDVKEVEIALEDIFELDADALVSPANSFGFMDGGIDQLYTDYFGVELEKTLQQRIRDQFYGELPVGQGVIIPIPNPKKNFKYFIAAPTMRVPEHIEYTINAYLAFRAVLITCLEHNKNNPDSPIKTVICPGLGTGIGRLSYKACAKQMRQSWEQVYTKKIEFPKSIFTAFSDHEALHKS